MLDAATETRLEDTFNIPSTPQNASRSVPLSAIEGPMADALDMLFQGSIVGDKLKALGRLLNKSVNDGDTVEELREAAHLAIDIMETMAARLDGFEQQARARWDHFREGLER